MPQYTSKYPGLKVVCRSSVIQRYADGTKEEIKPVLEVNFGTFGASHRMTTFTDDGDEVPVMASGEGLPGVAYETFEFQGGFIDLDEMIRQQVIDGNWDDEDVALVRRRMEEGVTNPHSPLFGWYERFEMPEPTPPWPTYLDMAEDVVAEFAVQLGLVLPALLYEQNVTRREKVIKALEAALSKEADAAEMQAVPVLT